MALNFVHCNGRQIPTGVLRRPPNLAQSKVFDRLRQLIEASSCEDCEFALASGRRGTHVLARLDELRAYLLSCGISAEAYQPPVPSGATVPRDDSGAPALKPYSDARADRLLISGRGHWDISPYLGPELQLPFLEPRVLLGCDTLAPYPDTSREDQDDRRPPGAEQEGRLLGVSHELPQGSLLCLYSVKPGFALCGASTDRSDYYHQVAVSKSRATSNAVGPPLRLSALSTTCAYSRFLRSGIAELGSHENCMLGRCGKKAFSLGVGDPLVCGAFSSLFQGDHGGVEYATAAHEGLLLEKSLLSPEQRLTAGRPPPLGDCAQALVIDDFFAVCQLPSSSLAGLPDAKLQEVLRNSPASDCIRQAKAAYEKVSLKGSDHKDNYGSLRYTVAGAEVISDVHLAQQGVVLVGAPLAKRFALSYVSLKTSCLPAVSEGLASSLLGGWVSYIQYRKPFGCFLDSAFRLAAKEPSPEGSPLRPLPRKAACELSLLAACAPLITTNVAVPYDGYAYCTDASLAKGAACRAFVGRDLSEALWHSSPRRGPFARLSKGAPPSKIPSSSPGDATRNAQAQVEQKQVQASRPAAVGAGKQVEALRKSGRSAAPGAKAEASPKSCPSAAARNAEVQVESSPVSSPSAANTDAEVQVETEARHEEPYEDTSPVTDGTSKRLGLDYDFVEVFGKGDSIVSAVADKGLRTGPRFSSEISPELDVTKPAPLEALLYLIPRHRVRRVLIDLPGGSFSRARAPALRSAMRPLGVTGRRKEVKDENRRASRAFIILEACRRAGVPCLLRQPAGSFLFALAWARNFLAKPGATKFHGTTLLGKPGRNYGFLCCHVSPCRARLRLSSEPDACLAELVCELAPPPAPADESLPPGLESILVDDVLLTSRWEVLLAWNWKNKRHINALESDATLALYKHVALEGGDRRCAIITDSSVVLGAHSKGRTSARVIKQPVRQASTTIIAGGVYPGLSFGPTRWNAADDPTRSEQLREPAGVPLCYGLSRDDLRALGALRGLNRPRANWVRLALALSTASLDGLPSLVSALRAFPSRARFLALPEVSPLAPFMDFDQTLGFPGEGPFSSTAFGLLLLLLPATGMITPRNRDDLFRQSRRFSSLPLGRPVQAATSSRRVVLVSSFEQWLREVTGRTLGSYFEAKPFDTENFVELIIAFGRDLYNSGRPYWHYSETINALTALKPALRRACQGAWDLAFTWLADEPSSHHLALPPILLMAILGVCLAWGWVSEAAIFSLSWGALLRISEATSATRGHLVFPKDALWMQSYVLIKIDQPKTRGRAAKHQSAKLEPADLVDIVTMAFQELPKHCKLWPHANQTLRRRLDAVLKRLGISGSSSQERGVDLGSFRPGGATYILQKTEDSELVRRRGRWVSMKVMEIYLQEVASSTYVADLPLQCREAVLYMAQLYPEILKTTMRWNENNIPSSSWWYLWP
ncbi:unnamed protein product [Symbiodinium sp. CCMP2456]|nr:unnamed protein product [Symbiodinium sp. CCMP2456]